MAQPCHLKPSITPLQGILGRPDWQLAAKVPLALLPAGSGNALSANTHMWDLSTALHAVIKVMLG